MSDEPKDTSGPYGDGRWTQANGKAYVPSAGNPQSGRKICGAKRKSDGKPCQCSAVMTNGRCKVHGGAALAGIASPSFKHGRTSKYFKHLPERMQLAFDEAMADPRITSMVDSVALIDARLAELLSSLDKPGPAWGKLFELVGKYEKCKTEGGKKTAWRNLVELVEEGEQTAWNTEAVWREIRGLLSQRGQCIFVEAKARKDIQAMVPVEEVMCTYRAILEAIKLNITDETLLRAVARDVMQLMPPPSDQRQNQAMESREAALCEQAALAGPTPAVPDQQP